MTRFKAGCTSADDARVGAHRSARGRGNRGATFVEYALIVSLLVVPCIGAIKRLDSNSHTYYNNAANDIGDLPQKGIDTSTGGSTPSATTTTSTSTTTTLPPTTTSTSTTTTSTSTTSTSTTTTTLLRSTINQLTDISTNNFSSYNAIARVKIVRTDNLNAVNGASVTVRMVDRFNNTTTKTCNTDSTGRCSVTWSRTDSQGPVTATVTNVTASPTWDGTQQSVSLVAI